MNELKDTEKETELEDVTTCTVEDLEEADTENISTADKQELSKDTSVGSSWSKYDCRNQKEWQMRIDNFKLALAQPLEIIL